FDDLNDVGPVLDAVGTELGFHPPGDPRVAGAFADPQLFGVGYRGRCVLSRLAALRNDVDRDAFALQLVPSVRVFPNDLNPVLGGHPREDVQMLAPNDDVDVLGKALVAMMDGCQTAHDGH